MTLTDLFAIAEGEVPQVNTVALDIERRLLAGPPGGPDALVTPQYVEQYARDILELLEEQASISPTMDTPLRVVEAVVESFPAAYSGSFIDKRKELKAWKEEYDSHRKLLVSQLRLWLENIKSSASEQSAREESYGPQWSEARREEKTQKL